MGKGALEVKKKGGAIWIKITIRIRIKKGVERLGFVASTKNRLARRRGQSKGQEGWCGLCKTAAPG